MNLKIGIAVIVVGIAMLGLIIPSVSAMGVDGWANCQNMSPMVTYLPGGVSVIWGYEGRNCESALRGCVRSVLRLTATRTSYFSRCSEHEYKWFFV